MVGISLEGKIACITGAGRGMGRVEALTLAKAGADVAVADINFETAEAVAKEIRDLGKRSIAIRVNIASRESAFSMIDMVVKELGGIDILVNNAAVTMMKDLEYVTEDEHDKIFNVNVKGTLFCMQAVLPHFKKQGSGKIVNLCSQAAKEAFAHNVTYSASKAAILSMTQGLAKEVGQYKINVNAVCPGMIMSDLWSKDSGDRGGLFKDMENVDAFKGMTHEEMWDVMCKDLLLGRPQTPEDIAGLVLFLSSSFADNMTGQGVNITGGMQMR